MPRGWNKTAWAPWHVSAAVHCCLPETIDSRGSPEGSLQQDEVTLCDFTTTWFCHSLSTVSLKFVNILELECCRILQCEEGSTLPKGFLNMKFIVV